MPLITDVKCLSFLSIRLERVLHRCARIPQHHLKLTNPSWSASGIWRVLKFLILNLLIHVKSCAQVARVSMATNTEQGLILLHTYWDQTQQLKKYIVKSQNASILLIQSYPSVLKVWLTKLLYKDHWQHLNFQDIWILFVWRHFMVLICIFLHLNPSHHSLKHFLGGDSKAVLCYFGQTVTSEEFARGLAI